AVERLGGFEGPIELKVTGLPPGVTVAPATIPAKQNSAQLTFKADPTAKISGAELAIEGTAEVGEPKQRFTHAAAVLVVRPAEPGRASTPLRGQPPLERLALAVGLPTPFKFKSTYQVTYAGQGTTLR